MLKFLQFWIFFWLMSEVRCQCDAGTRPLELTATSTPEYLFSLNYPSNYDNNLDCQWRISSSSSNPVMINIEDVDIESSTACVNDSLTVYDGNTTAATPLYTVCSGNDDDNVIVSTHASGAFYVTFTTNGAVTGRGFEILYFVVDAVYQPSCGSSLVANTSELFLYTTTLPAEYAPDLACTYDVTAPAGYTVNISYYLIDLEEDASCTFDKLVVYDGSDNSATALATQCTTAIVYDFTSSLTTGESAHIEFITNNNNPGYGYVISYRALLTTTNCTTNTTNLSATEHHNYITTVDFGSSRYARNLDCLWLITAPAGQAVEVQFVLLTGETYSLEYNYYCSYDYIILYDGSNITSPLIHRFCGSTIVSQTHRSSSTDMLVVFSADYALQKNGFRLGYKAVDNTYPGCTKDYVNILYPLYNVGSSYISNNYTYKNTTSSVNYPYRYNIYTDEFWLISNSQPSLYSVFIEMIRVDIERSPSCSFADKLVIYNGSCIKDGPLYTICGYTEASYELTGSDFLVHFHSDGSHNRLGFSFEYYADFINVTVPGIPITTTNGPPVEAVINAVKTALENYTTENLPNKDLTDAISATFDFYLVGINGLDEVEQTLTTTGQFEVTWVDVSLSWLPEKQQGVVRILFPQDDVWKPDIVLLNGVTKITAMGASFMFVDVDYNGTCIWKPYQILQTTCKVDMTYYPYDIQTCFLKFSTWGSRGSDVTTRLGELGLQLHSGFQANSVWDLLSTETIQDVEDGQNVVKFKLTMQRKPAYVTFYITIPLVMLAYLNVFTFAIPCESGEKSGFSVTVFLSFIVVLIVITTSMPDNSDSISLYGAYIFAMTLMSAVTVVISIVQIRALTLDEEDHPIANRIKSMILALQRRKWKIFKQKSPVKNFDNSSETKTSSASYKHSSNADELSDMEVLNDARSKTVSFAEDSAAGEDDEEDLVDSELKLQRQLTTASIMFDREDTCMTETSVIVGYSSMQGSPEPQFTTEADASDEGVDYSEDDGDDNSKEVSINTSTQFAEDQDREKNSVQDRHSALQGTPEPRYTTEADASDDGVIYSEDDGDDNIKEVSVNRSTQFAEGQDRETNSVQKRVTFSADVTDSENDGVSNFRSDSNAKSSGVHPQHRQATSRNESTPHGNEAYPSFSEDYVGDGSSSVFDRENTIMSLPPSYESLGFIDNSRTRNLGGTRRPLSMTGMVQGPKAVTDNLPMSSISRQGSFTDQRPFSRLSQSRPAFGSGREVANAELFETISYDDSVAGSYSESDSDTTEDGDSDDPSWPDLVHASDIVLFFVYFVITTILTGSFLAPIAFNNG